MDIHKEINQNMAVSAGGEGFALNNDELESLKNNQVWANSRANRRKAGVDKPTQRNNTKEWVNKSNLNNSNINASNLVQPSSSNIVVQQWPVDENLQAPESVNKNNKNSSEDIDTIRENIRNSKESIRKSSSENILAIEESMRKNLHKTANNTKQTDKNMATVQKSTDNNISTVQKATDNTLSKVQKSTENNMSTVQKTTDNNMSKVQKTTDNNMSTVQKSTDNNTSTVQQTTDNTMSTIQKTADTSANLKPVDTKTLAVQTRNNPSTLRLNNAKTTADSSDVLNASTADLNLKSPTSPTTKDPHTAYIDLSNNCRQFYFSHLKTAEAIKQSVRSARHNKAMDKVQGKSSSGIDNAMDRLRAEMADLVDQDLSLMSQLLTLNDKIEEIKHHVRNSAEPLSQSFSYMSTGDVTDSEYSDLEESGIFNSDFSLRRESLALNASLRGVTKPTVSTVSLELEVDVREVKPRKIEPSEREIIVYRKKKTKHKDRNGGGGGGGKARSRNNSSAEDSDVTDEESDDVSDDSNDDSESDTESTISCNSSDNNSVSDLTETESKDDQVDSGVQTPTQPPKKPEVTKPVKGGISRNRFFLKFHKKNGVSDAISGGNSVLTLQGHHIPLEKFYIPQGLVYLKQSESENVFCQFSH